MKKPMDFAQTNLLLEQYINGTLQKYDLLFCLFGGNGREVPPQERSRFLLEYLHRVTETQNGGGAEYAVILHEVLSCKDPQTLAAFQKLLAQDWHERHEDIVTLLAECPSESSLPHLVKAFAFDPPYADRYPLQKKIMWAVYRIAAGGRRGAEILQPLAKSAAPELQKEFRQFASNIVAKP
ncbi:hypothetical protein ACG2K1_01170 [Neisseria sp. 23W00296]|uniref:hypothetical protein n=1 Tax=unclassified Neisseria TaxID=2623750 RepID=UPI0002A37909|nr:MULTISPECIES: hypothetical protein [unclassified Neisseria]EKY02712.1 hypothetical protein HMPREF9120_02837 [Neisseria sp. oral taxon 020 str. F0370]